MTAILIAHISGGVLALLSGFTALVATKGEQLHRQAGKVFFLAMMLMGAGASYLGYAGPHPDPSDIVAGVLTMYLVATAWGAAVRKDARAGAFEVGAFLVAAIGSTAAFLITLQTVRDGTAFMNGVPGFIFAGVAGLGAVLDLSMILRQRISDKHRIARHVWRMTLGFFIAVGSFFPGQIQIFPTFVRETEPVIILFIPAFSVLGVMIFWLVRVLFTDWMKQGEKAPA